MEARWNAYIPRKVSILIWHVLRDRVSDHFNHSKLSLDVPLIMCPLCNLEAKQLDRSFFKSHVATRTWDTIFKWLDISHPQNGLVCDLFLWIDQLPILVKKKRLVDAVICTVICLFGDLGTIKFVSGGMLKQSDIVDCAYQFSFICFANRNAICNLDMLTWFKNPFNSL